MSSQNYNQFNILAKINNSQNNKSSEQPLDASNHQFNNDQRQAALASLFSSLSSLAASQQQQHLLANAISPKTHHQESSPPPPPPLPHQQPPPLSSMATSTTSALTNSIQSVVAAAMMQQQLVAAALRQQQQQRSPIQTQPLPPPPPPPQPPSLHSTQSVISSFLGEHLRSTGGFSQALDQDVQLNTTFSQPQQHLQQQSTQQQQQQQQQLLQQPQPQQSLQSGQQRINYCTICNKELCNKYFMKTHMLKMHGINLEMEQPDDDNQQQDNDDDDHDHDHEDDSRQGGDEVRSESDNIEIGDSKGGDGRRRTGNSSGFSQDLSESKQQKGRQPKLSRASLSPSSSSSSTNNKMKSSSSGGTKQATSVMNGFAGNSMGGVVCDICNKELCSKYFLKVHKQNTHGIQTDYQDAGQFVYPFAGGPLVGPNPFMAGAPLGLPPASNPTFPSSPLAFLNNNNNNNNDNNNNNNQLGCNQNDQMSLTNDGLKSAKRARLMTTEQRQRRQLQQQQHQLHSNNNNHHHEQNDLESRSGDTSLIDSLNCGPAKGKQQHQRQPLDSVYRLMLAGGQASQQAGQAPLLQAPPAPQIMAPFDPVAANPMGGLMCFGAMGLFGPASMSPAMIVDYILRNQHLFNANKINNNNNGNSSSGAGPAKSGGNKTNASENNSKQNKASTKNAKDSGNPNNSRYFSHYTEACPMCDRRFKSIKWLKTHMMNDHKQEIGAYMQMMVQYLYSNKSQQVAASMAVLEHQQHLHQQQNYSQINSNQQQQQQHQLQQQLLSKCLNLTRNEPATVAGQPSLVSFLDQSQARESPRSDLMGQQQQHIYATHIKLESGIHSTDAVATSSATPEDLILVGRRRQLSCSPSDIRTTPGDNLHNLNFNLHQDYDNNNNNNNDDGDHDDDDGDARSHDTNGGGACFDADDGDSNISLSLAPADGGLSKDLSPSKLLVNLSRSNTQSPQQQPTQMQLKSSPI